ncbi:ParB/RepB/Spo0J family partition protein [Commensalibacter communis]|uniref:Contains ParB-like nuclease domain (Spo0J) n=1 Tax=Commensalibacter communis TaxID=2972786 RepID=A0A9W4TNN9_9PROT|nr:ParB/RepB/Spo0J family partition protein [Commensalibacter communis]CAI3938397.1 Chromosome segregation protein Spo0J [Commensalibacter communis]CAI3939857.1 Chromosome segregation protein Spo0J [Commensalibacter communis]CAI3940023.1 Chromosome segregation protein Spo0J [Commensalibacter communis]CAI3940315.1 Chromosome segregation protein Spo0J [Commensalibacter communis]CAI3943170.1 Chromosome segregation protein Spo0J [Commensalibacter communis]
MAGKKGQEKARLGRGLAALLGNAVEETVQRSQKNSADLSNAPISLLNVPIEFVEPGPFQPRQVMMPEALQELADSIKHHGILQPLLVREKPGSQGHYQIIAGERRWRAAQLATIHEVPVRVCQLSDSDAMAAALVENLQRADLNIVEEAEGFSRLLEEFELTQDELASAVGKSRPHIANTIRLLQLPQEVRQFLKEGKLTAGHARALLMHPDPVAAAKEVIQRGLTVRQTEELVKRDQEKKPRTHKEIEPLDAEIKLLEKDLRSKLGLNIQIKFDGKGGSVQIYYKSLEQFDELLGLLKK